MASVAPTTEITIKDLIAAGVHFGHRASRWNPKMKPYIYTKRNLIHVIDVRETVRGMLRAKKYLQQVAQNNSLILFVGTKRQATESVERAARACSMPYAAQRWLGGTLTNFRTIRSRLSRLEELEGLRETGEISTYSKKMQSSLSREYRKLYRNLNGIRDMNRMPECLVIFDPKKEKNAIREAQRLGIVTVALIDTDCDPDMVDLPIPGNDDSIRSIELIANYLAGSINEARGLPAFPQEMLDEIADAEAGKTQVGWKPLVAPKPVKPKVVVEEEAEEAAVVEEAPAVEPVVVAEEAPAVEPVVATEEEKVVE